MRSNKSPPEWLRALVLFQMIAVELVGWTLLGLGLGYGLNRVITPHSFYPLIGGVTGFAISMIRVVKRAQKFQSRH